MDVNFTNSSGTQMPLANIVESNSNYNNGFIRFDNGIQIVYSSEPMLSVEQSEEDNSLIISKIIYEKPFSSYPALTHGSMSALITYTDKKSPIPMTKSISYNNVIFKTGSFKVDGKEITSNEGFIATIQSTTEIASNMHMGSFMNYLSINYIAIGKWK